MPNAILTKLSKWEYSNGDAPFSQRKSGRVSHLVHYGTPIGFRICVFSAYRHARIVMSWRLQSVACWCVSHTQGNQCHLVTLIKTITLRWSCTQYSMNMHLWQLPWTHTHITRSKAVRDRAPGPFYECWAKPTWMGGVMLLPLKIEVRLVIFSPLRLGVLQWSRHLFNYWKNKKTIIEKFLILLIWNLIYIDHRKITWLWS